MESRKRNISTNFLIKQILGLLGLKNDHIKVSQNKKTIAMNGTVGFGNGVAYDFVKLDLHQQPSK